MDSYTKLLLHFDGTDAVTSYTAETKQIVTFAGTAQLDTAQYKFGTASLLLDGNSDYVTLPDSDDWDFGTGDFTIDCRVRFSNISGTQTICGQYEDGSNFWQFKKDSDQKLSLEWIDDLAWKGITIMSSAWSGLTTDTQYHLAFIRNGSTVKIFINGVSQSLSEIVLFNSNDLGDIGGTLDIGALNGSGGYTNFVNGWIDEVRISKGIARWTGTFTPPTTPYDAASISTPYYLSVGEKYDAAILNAIFEALTVGAIYGGSIIAQTIVGDKIAPATIQGSNIVADAIGASHIASNTISADHIASDAITATKILSGAVTTDKLYAGAVTADKLSVTSLDAISANLGEVTSGTITAGIVRTSANPGVNRVIMDAAGLRGYDSSFGLTFKIPTDGTAPLFSNGIIQSATIIDTDIISNSFKNTSTLPWIEIDNDGISFRENGNDALYGTATYTNDESGGVYGPTQTGFLFNDSKPVLSIEKERVYADIHLYNRASAVPSGASTAGDICAINGTLRFCTTGGTPGTYKTMATTDAVGNAILGDAAGRVLRVSRLTIEDGTNADTIKVTLASLFNGDTIGATDNIAKNATTGNYSLDASGNVLKLLDSGITGTVQVVASYATYNTSTVALYSPTSSVVDSNIQFIVNSDFSGTNWDWTDIVSNYFIFDICYITNA